MTWAPGAARTARGCGWAARSRASLRGGASRRSWRWTGHLAHPHSRPHLRRSMSRAQTGRRSVTFVGSSWEIKANWVGKGAAWPPVAPLY
jgi:hypothetical protein